MKKVATFYFCKPHTNWIFLLDNIPFSLNICLKNKVIDTYFSTPTLNSFGTGSILPKQMVNTIIKKGKPLIPNKGGLFKSSTPSQVH